jgi:hypothetical protein
MVAYGYCFKININSGDMNIFGLTDRDKDIKIIYFWNNFRVNLCTFKTWGVEKTCLYR